MTWFKVCDTANMHTKIVAASGDAVKMWVRAGSWSAQQLSDGFVPDAFVPILGSPDLADELVRLDLWERREKPTAGYVFHDWSHYQPSKSQIEKRRADDRTRQSNRRGRRHGVTPDVTPAESHNVSGRGEERTLDPLLSPAQRESRRDTVRNPESVQEKCGHTETDLGCPICRRFLSVVSESA